MDNDDKYLHGILVNIHLHIDLVDPVMHELQSGPHRPCKSRQQESKEDGGNDICERLASYDEES